MEKLEARGMRRNGIPDAFSEYVQRNPQGGWQSACGAPRYVRGRAFDLLLVLVVTVIFFLRFGVNLLNTYGYGASDMIVHNYWVNALSEGKLFVAGVYPYGFHCLMYYMHELFGIDNYVLLRIFWIVQTLMALYGLLVFLKGCCKNRYLPYLGAAGYLFATLGVLAGGTYLRLFSSLPQNFGMVFILPSVQFLFLFFEKKKAELDHGEAAGKDARRCLAGFAMSLALAISIHFYNAMIIGLFCVGGLVGYGFRLFRKQYFLSVIAAGMIAVVIAALPMVIAVLNGTPLEGSLNWGLSIMKNPSAAEEAGLAPSVEEGAVADNTGCSAETAYTGSHGVGTEDVCDSSGIPRVCKIPDVCVLFASAGRRPVLAPGSSGLRRENGDNRMLSLAADHYDGSPGGLGFPRSWMRCGPAFIQPGCWRQGLFCWPTRCCMG